MTSGPGSAESGVETLLDRAHEVDVIGATIQAGAQGRGDVLIVDGEAGIGKSRLLAFARARAASAQLVALGAAAEEYDRRRPFATICRCLDVRREGTGLRARIFSLLQSPPSVAGDRLEFIISEALLELAEELTVSAPLLIVIDDLHWADPMSLEVVRQLEALSRPSALTLLIASRPCPRESDAGALLSLLRSRGARWLKPGPLKEESLVPLVRRLTGAEPGPRLRSALIGCGGNPFYLREAMAAFEKERTLARDETGRVDLRSDRRPPSLALTILGSMHSIEAATLDLLRLASVLGRGFSIAELSELADAPAATLVRPVREALDARVLEQSDDRLFFRHDVLREALYDDIPIALRQALHRQVGSQLRAAGAPADEVAEHYLRQARSADWEAVERIRDGARAVAPRAPSLASELLASALDLVPEETPDRGSILAEWIELLIEAGKLPEAEQQSRMALERNPDRPLERSFRRLHALSLLQQSRMAQADRALGIALDDHGNANSERLFLLGLQSWARAGQGRLEEAQELATQALAQGTPDGHGAACSFARQTLAFTARVQGNPQRSVEIADQQLAAEAAEQSRAPIVPIRVWKGLALIDLDRFDQALEVLQRGRLLAETHGQVAALPFYRTVIATRHYLAGTWDDALAELEVRDQGRLRTGIEWRQESLLLTTMISFQRGELEAAMEAVAVADAAAHGPGPRYRQAALLRTKGWLLEGRGNPEAAFTMMKRAWTVALRQRSNMELPALVAELLRLCPPAEATRIGREALLGLAPLKDRWRTPTTEAAVRLAQGAAEADDEALLDGVRLYGASPRLLDQALALEAAGRLLAHHRRLAEAGSTLRASAQLLEGLEALQSLSRVDAQLRSLGIRRRHPARKTRSQEMVGWESLTRTESRVADLVVDGLSNRAVAERLFVSHRTVGTHVSHILAKLHLASRVELAVYGAQRRA
ncbi:MAG: ATP-binding protein [Candidatus Dormibacteraceae bacterium]